jgi:cell division transport system permease protein
MNSWLARHGQALTLAMRRLGASPLSTALSLLAIGIALALPAAGQMLLANALQLARHGADAPDLAVHGAVGRQARHP